MVGGGVLGDVSKTKSKEEKYVVRSQMEMLEYGISKGMRWEKQAVASVMPSNNTLQLGDGSTYTYDYLVIAPGMKLRYDKIPGATEALEDPDCPVGSIYSLDYAYKFSELRDSFKGG